MTPFFLSNNRNLINSKSVIDDTIKYCSKCGNEISENVKFCPSCGNGGNNSSQNVINNPKTGTGNYLLFILVILIISSALYLNLRKKKNYIMK